MVLRVETQVLSELPAQAAAAAGATLGRVLLAVPVVAVVVTVFQAALAALALRVKETAAPQQTQQPVLVAVVERAAQDRQPTVVQVRTFQLS
jgi:hypothetical protein